MLFFEDGLKGEGIGLSAGLSLTGKSRAAFLGFRGRARASAFLRFGGAVRYVRPGSTFRRKDDNTATETARVVSVGTDIMGIPHVRYDLVIERPHRRMTDGPRSLSGRSFAARYTESVSKDSQ